MNTPAEANADHDLTVGVEPDVGGSVASPDSLGLARGERRTQGSHRVSAVYTTREEAEAVRERLVDGGIASGAVEILHAGALPVAEQDSDEVLKNVLVDGAIGTAVGTGVGVVGTLVLWGASVTLFVASPVIAPLAMLGWFAGLGGVVGAVAGARSDVHSLGKEGRFAELVLDAIQSGHAVLTVRAADDIQKQLAENIIRDSLKGRDEAALKSA